MATTTSALMTIEEFEQLPDDGNRYELVEGELVEMSGNNRDHTRLACRLICFMFPYLESKPIGAAFTEAACVLRRAAKATLRIPDAAYFSAERLNEEEEGVFYHGAPDFAVEVVSPSESATALNSKIQEYFDAGSRIVAVIYPEVQQIYVYRSSTDLRVLGPDDTLELPELLPGWSLEVRRLFDQPWKRSAQT